jgi:hypothetical protein
VIESVPLWRQIRAIYQFSNVLALQKSPLPGSMERVRKRHDLSRVEKLRITPPQNQSSISITFIALPSSNSHARAIGTTHKLPVQIPLPVPAYHTHKKTSLHTNNKQSQSNGAKSSGEHEFSILSSQLCRTNWRNA